MLRMQVTDALKDAMRNKDERCVAAIRLIMAKLKDLDIAARPKGIIDGISDVEIQSMLQGMIKQRRESMELYQKGNRADLVEQERKEIIVIERFLPKQMDEEEIKAAIKKIVAATGAKDVKDMGKVMAEMKKAYGGQMDNAKASAMVKLQLTA
jgi:uncharacterized protein YqeY